MIRAVAITLASIVAFVGVALFVPADAMTETLSVAVLIAAAWGLTRWGMAAVRAYARGARTVEEQGVIGIVLLLLAIIAQRVYSFLYLQFDRPEAWQALHISPFIVYTSLIALVLFIAATRYEGERPTGIGGFAAAAIAFLAVMFSSIGPFIVSKLGAIVSVLVHVVR
jgi:hypothetical protein